MASPAPFEPAAQTRALPLGDAARLGDLLRQLQPRLTAVALRLTKDPDGARDVVQNAFEKVIRHAGSFHGHSRVSTWVHRIVTNEALMWLRCERRRGQLLGHEPAPDAALADPAPGPAEALERRQRVRRLRDGLARLSREDRDVLLRCGLAEQSYADYSRRTGLHPAAVKSRAFRARRRLEALLGAP